MPTTLRLELPTLHAGQTAVLEEARRFNVVDCGRRWGKSTLGMDLAIDPALDGHPVAYYEPTYPYLEEVWRELKRLLPEPIGTPSEQQHRIDLITGGSIKLWSLSDIDSSRGFKYKRVVIDEAAKVPGLQEAWQATIRPTLTDLEGDAWFLSTPKGYNAFYDLWRLGQEGGSPHWKSWTRPSRENPHLPEGEIERARLDMDARLFKQEYEASFESSSGAVFTEGVERDLDLSVLATTLGMPGLRCYSPRRVGGIYFIGADVAEGLEHGDASCAVVLEQSAPNTFVEAAHLHERVPPDQFAEHLHQLASAYPGLLGVERNNHGHAVLLRLRQLRESFGAPYALFRDPSGPLKAPVEGAAYRVVHKGREDSLGWLTTRASKPVLVDGLEEALRKGWLHLGTPELVDELRMYERDANGETGAPEGKHDDRVMALGIAYQMHVYRDQYTARRTAPAVTYIPKRKWS